MDQRNTLGLGGKEVIILDPLGQLEQVAGAGDGQFRVAKHDERADIQLVVDLANGKLAGQPRNVHRISRHIWKLLSYCSVAFLRAISAIIIQFTQEKSSAYRSKYRLQPFSIYDISIIQAIMNLFKGEHDMKQQLEAIRAAAVAAMEGAANADDLEALRVQYLGKKGELTAVLKQMGKLSAEERPVIGQLANEIRAKLENAIESRAEQLASKAMAMRLISETVDVTIPGTAQKLGKQHPMYQVLDEIKDIFIGLGFEVIEDREVELSEYNFTKLNVEEGHPAREWSDTFYFTEDSSILLRTQTSPMQIHAMESRPLPIRMIAPGRVYRKDEVDATHSPMFHQIEGMAIDKGITMADLKGTLNTVVKSLYGEDTVTRFRPHHFPFTEPSCEMDIQCYKCHGVGCPTCKGEGWIEVLGAGMIHPKVLEGCGIDSSVYSGWAFGFGLERLALGQYKISDLRLIFENDVRFLEQF